MFELLFQGQPYFFDLLPVWLVSLIIGGLFEIYDFFFVVGFRFRMPENSIPKEAAYQIINDELMLDGNPRLNLASFVTTWMEPECDKLIMAAINKNYVDMDEYPVTTELQASFCSSLLVISFLKSQPRT